MVFASIYHLLALYPPCNDCPSNRPLGVYRVFSNMLSSLDAEIDQEIFPFFFVNVINGIIQYVKFCAWCLSFCIMLLKFIRVVGISVVLFLFIVE